MPIQNIIQFLRQSVLVQDPDVVAVDEDFLSITEEEFIILLQVALGRVDPQDNIFSLAQENLYPLILVAKKELYHRLAVKTASEYTITSSSGATLNKSDIFDHYYQLIEEVESEYKTYLTTGVPVVTGEILLSSRYFTQRNYNLAKKPSVRLNLDNFYTDKAELSWAITKINHFAKCSLYISENPVIDKYSQDNKIDNKAKQVFTTDNIHKDCFRIENLQPNTTYYVCVLVEERNGLIGYNEIKFTTLGGE